MSDRDKYLKDELFLKWVNSEDDEINNYWERWMKEHPKLSEEARQHRDLIRSMKYKEFAPEKGQIDQSWNSVRATALGRRTAIAWNRFLKIAAVILFFGLAFFTIRYMIHPGRTPAFQANEVVLVEKHAEKGIKLTVQLPDGSKIKLNSGSKLIYPEVFADYKREVQLIGEGYFDVAYDKDRTFVVKTENLMTTVLGTKFSIDAYDTERIQVSLESGRVKVEELRSEKLAMPATVMLEPGFKAVFERDNFKKEKVDQIKDLGWKDDIIAFDNSNIRDIVIQLENWYGVEFEVRNEHKINVSFNGVYEKEVLSNVLESMAHAMNFRYEISGKKVYVTGI